MSRIGKKAIVIPEKTEVIVSDGVVSVKGPLGELSWKLHSSINAEVKDGAVITTPKDEGILTKALWGTNTSLISNMIEGVNKLYEKRLVVEGVGFKAELSVNNLVLNIGFSHPVSMEIPEDLTVLVEKNIITISGISKQKVGQFAAAIRSEKKPEPYKGKGIRYEDEVIRRKEGKKVV